MAKLDDLIAQVSDDRLREHLEEAAKELRRRKKFGLVYEQHIPETALLPASSVRKGSVVMMRTEPENKTRYVVDALTKTKATITAEDEAWNVPIADLSVVKPFGEPAYPFLRLTESIRRSDTRPFHAVISGENFHALKLLRFGYRGRVDVIYVDPPYNAGGADWTYNNDYLDLNDRYRHSKWLSMMEKRLCLARQLLKPDAVLVVTIDENEVSRLGVLLQQLFPDATTTLVTIVNNPKGVTRTTLSRVEEYAYFCFFGAAQLTSISDDLLTPGADEIDDASGRGPRWKGLLRSGSNSLREQHPTFFYPVLIDSERGAIVGAGASPPLDISPDPDELIDGWTAVWPVRRDGKWGRWMLKPQTLREWAEKGYVALGQRDAKRKTWGISYLTTEPQAQIAAGILEVRGRDPKTGVVEVAYAPSTAASRRVKTVWHRTSHDAGVGGTAVLEALLGGRIFDYPKSVYAVRDTLAMLTKNNPTAVILDFFAGSGTTLHATVMLNAEDGGHRRCILVTDNEVEAATAKRLNAAGAFRGDPDFEARGICESVTKPRVRAVLSGHRPDGSAAPGAHLGGRPFAAGFDENAAFFEVDFADPDRIEVGAELTRVLPTLWLTAGGVGTPDAVGAGSGWVAPAQSPFAVLLDEDEFREFGALLSRRPDITHVWLVTDSDAAYSRMRHQLTGRGVIGMLPRDYLRNFRSGDLAADNAEL